MVNQQEELKQAQRQPLLSDAIAAEVGAHRLLRDDSLDTSLGDTKTGLKLDLACGVSPREGFTGLDLFPLDELRASDPQRFADGAEGQFEGYIQQDLFDIPWKIESNSVAVAYSAHFVEHIPHYHPDYGINVDFWWVFFKELYRVMEPDGIVEILHPFSRSDRAFWDPTHTRYIHLQTWFYLQKNLRQAYGVNHYAAEMDFEVVNIQTVREPTYMQGKNAQVVDFVRQFYWNVTDDLFVVLRANK